MKKRYIQPSAEFEEIEGLNSLLEDGGSKYMVEPQGVNEDVTPEGMGGGIFDKDKPINTDDDPNG